MNDDDLEQKLTRQRVRAIPMEWKDSILEKIAGDPACQCDSRVEARFSWRDLFWPSPRAWATLAAAWFVILFLNSAASENPALTSSASVTIRTSKDWSMAIEEQEVLRAELMGLPEVVQPSETPTPRPRVETGKHRFEA